MKPFFRCHDDTRDPGAELFKNDVYQVHRRDISEAHDGSVIHLSIKRIDREPCRDWRDFQEIKNTFVGPEAEALELYPAESRLVDQANQFHLWCFAAPFRIPIGFQEGRRVATTEEAARAGAKQREIQK